ncbi:mechanosensitive ion channel family protein [Myxococcota bacterium]|nr:mechanosensitive ion channel family protein [Myxococcota bacterium]
MRLMTRAELQAWLTNHGDVRDAMIALGVALLALLSLWVARKVFVRVAHSILKKTEVTWDDALIERGVLDKLAWLAPAVVVYWSTRYFASDFEPALFRLLGAYTITIFLIVIGGLISAFNDVYAKTEMAKDVPIKGYLQVLKIVLYVVGGIVAVAIAVDKSPWFFLSGIGAATAIFVLVFKDTILSFIASIQLASNDMIRLGDWIEMPKYDANGEVVDLALHTVKVQNWDLTITTIPTFKLIEDSFKNWRGMQQSGARRIKRAINLDVASIAFLDDADLERLKRVRFLADYLADKSAEIDKYNREHGVDTTVKMNGRRLTNLGTLRAYLQRYLEAHPKILKDRPVLVRQLDPTPNGVPMEIYVFTSETSGPAYEALVGDLFDHVLASIPELGLRVYQQPSVWGR